MRIQLTQIQPIDDRTHNAVLQVGDRVISSRINEFVDGDVRGLTIESDVFNSIVYFTGIGQQFGMDFWSYVDGSPRPLPWDYGEQDAAIVARASGIQ